MARAESQKTQERAWRQAYSERRFGVLLVILVALLAGPPILFGFGLSAEWFNELMALLLVAAILSLCFERRQRLFALLLGIPTVLLSVAGHALLGEASVPVLFAGNFCEVLFLFGTSVLIVKSLFSARTPTFDSILGAVCGYLFRGLGWAVLYVQIEGFRPGSFEISPKLVTGGEVLAEGEDGETWVDLNPVRDGNGEWDVHLDLFPDVVVLLRLTVSYSFPNMRVLFHIAGRILGRCLQPGRAG